MHFHIDFGSYIHIFSRELYDIHKKSSILYISTIGCVQKTIYLPPLSPQASVTAYPENAQRERPVHVREPQALVETFAPRWINSLMITNYQDIFDEKKREKWMNIGIGRFFQWGKMILMIKPSKCQASNGIHAISHDVRMLSQPKDFLNLKGCELRYNEIIFIRCRISSINSSIVGSLRLDIWWILKLMLTLYFMLLSYRSLMPPLVAWELHESKLEHFQLLVLLTKIIWLVNAIPALSGKVNHGAKRL